MDTGERDTPRMIVVAGPAGGGKSTIFPLRIFCVDFFNIDDRCAALNGSSYTGITPLLRTRVASECRSFVEQHIADGTSLAVETTLRTDAAIEQAKAAKSAGFTTVLLFVGTDDVGVNIDRIKARGWMGGHASPEADIRAIFAASMANLSRAIEVFDYVECFNNSLHGGRPSRVLALIERRVVYRATPLPDWLGAFA